MTLVHPADTPDPYVRQIDGSYWLWSTQRGSVDVPVLTSPDLVRWTPAGNALGRLPAWDPFVDVDGTAYLTRKSDDNAVGRRSSLWVRRLAPDGLGFAGRAVRLLRHTQPWERPLVEAPSITLLRGRYHLLYSAGAWQSAGYGIGHAVAGSVTGPYALSSVERPWLSGLDGPGGQSVVTGPDGRPYLARHGWLGPIGYRAGGVRALHVDPLDLSGPSPRLLTW